MGFRLAVPPSGVASLLALPVPMEVLVDEYELGTSVPVMSVDSKVLKLSNSSILRVRLKVLQM